MVPVVASIRMALGAEISMAASVAVFDVVLFFANVLHMVLHQTMVSNSVKQIDFFLKDFIQGQKKGIII